MKLLLLIRILWEANIAVSSAYPTTESSFVIIWLNIFQIHHYQIICQRYRLRRKSNHLYFPRFVNGFLSPSKSIRQKGNIPLAFISSLQSF